MAKKGGETVVRWQKVLKKEMPAAEAGVCSSQRCKQLCTGVNGTGGNISTLCSAKGVNMLNVESSFYTGCQKGGYPEGNAGGNGTGIKHAEFWYGKTIYAGGNGGIAGNNSNGKTGSGYGTGGGGAGLF